MSFKAEILIKFVITVCIIISYYVWGTSMTDRFATKLEVGQIWIYETDTDNPFKESIQCEYRIMALDKGYVQYQTSTGRVRSEREQLFRVDSTLKEP